MLCVWSSDEWENQASRVLEIPAGASWRTPTPAAPTHVQVHQDQFHLLVVHETQIAIYDAPKQEYNKQMNRIHKSPIFLSRRSIFCSIDLKVNLIYSKNCSNLQCSRSDIGRYMAVSWKLCFPNTMI
ncbi:topless-related protein 4 [Rhododendron vialii]|uniref:topless-related protein 4 n=1 Tax=Rhododendron vialii TaxID=182163 RepID=UPI0026603D40|nr:topless-related protein 4 [Rhododendron vialii]